MRTFLYDRSSYEAEMAENTPVQTTIVSVHASDRDAGENGHVTYRWADQTDSAYGSLFGIDAESGDVYLKSQLDYEQQQVYKVRIKPSLCEYTMPAILFYRC